MGSFANELADFDSLWDYSRPAETEREFLALLPAAREAGDPDRLAQLLTQIARTQGLQRRFDEAHATLDEVEGMLTEDLTVARVRYHLERGRALNSGGERALAKEQFDRALDVGLEGGHDFHAVDAAHMLEIVAKGEEKLTWNLRACRIAENSESERARGWLSSLYNNRGWTYHELGRLEEARETFELRLEWLRENDGSAEQIGVARWSEAKMLRLLGRPEAALAIQTELLETSETDGFVHEELGECLLALGRPDEARPHFARAHALLVEDPWLSRDEPERLERLRSLGEP